MVGELFFNALYANRGKPSCLDIKKTFGAKHAGVDPKAAKRENAWFNNKGPYFNCK
jgi:hypothetical protein